MTDHSRSTTLIRRFIPTGDDIPEAVRYGAGVWWFMVAAEILRHIVSTVFALVHPHRLVSRILDQLSADQAEQLRALGDGFTIAVVASYYLIVLAVAITIMCVVGWMVRSVVTRGKKVGLARRVLTVFAIYFALRGGMLALAPPPDGTASPTGMLVDGVFLVAIGVAAVLSLIYFGKKESVEWTTPPPQDS